MLIFPVKSPKAASSSRITCSPKHDSRDLADEAVNRFEDQGAERLRILDVDAALGREQTNADLIEASSTQLDQESQAMRTALQIDSWLEAGAAHVVLGTLAITNQSLLAEIARIIRAQLSPTSRRAAAAS